ncbi:YdhK family protein [Neobacillus terrae]|uniref:YdhK family protein n=1 Tax=Neobacillus terrae TaxID=3034837 RepID=UPI00140C8E2D|nr:YdhK family protein [Neobacillus terrae]NHM31958.1 YdhK family protein [Neobacillus terrae]
MKKKQFTLLTFLMIISFILAACSGGQSKNESMDHSKKSGHEGMNMDHSNMDMSASGELPKGIKEAKNPTFPVGSKAVIHAVHMEGMNGAEATIVGAYDTTVYAISYTPTTGGEKVTNHKWIVQEEIKGAENQTYKREDEVEVTADHMKGMKGAKAVIDSAEHTTVYMVDYTPASGGKKVTNHQWVTESELTAK